MRKKAVMLAVNLRQKTGIVKTAEKGCRISKQSEMGKVE
jgi:hypothetical protein